MSISAHFLGRTGAVIPRRTNGVKDLRTLEVEAVGDDDVAEEEHVGAGFRRHRPLQAGPGRLQQSLRDHPLPQVLVLGDGVDDDVSLWNKSHHLSPIKALKRLYP